MITAEELQAALEEVGSVGDRPCSLHPAGVVERGGALVVVLRLVVWDGDSVNSVVEQEVRFVAEVHRDEPDRVRRYVAGWAAAAGEVLPHVPDFVMPADLVDASVLGLARAETEEDFRVALLRRSRLGKLLPAG